MIFNEKNNLSFLFFIYLDRQIIPWKKRIIFFVHISAQTSLIVILFIGSYSKAFSFLIGLCLNKKLGLILIWIMLLHHDHIAGPFSWIFICLSTIGKAFLHIIIIFFFFVRWVDEYWSQIQTERLKKSW